MIQIVPNALTEDTLRAMRQHILTHPLVDRSTLRGSFQGSRGFAMVFRRQGIEELVQRFPFLQPFISLVVSPSKPWYQRVIDPDDNAFYLNLLLLSPGGAVGRHIDATLCSHLDSSTVRPASVSVLYLQVPQKMRGGQLHLFQGEKLLQSISPEVGTLVHFAGHLGHSVEAVQGSGVRASLVCERYRLKRRWLRKLTPFQVQSKAAFGAYLHEADQLLDHKLAEPDDDKL